MRERERERERNGRLVVVLGWGGGCLFLWVLVYLLSALLFFEGCVLFVCFCGFCVVSLGFLCFRVVVCFFLCLVVLLFLFFVVVVFVFFFGGGGAGGWVSKPFEQWKHRSLHIRLPDELVQNWHGLWRSFWNQRVQWTHRVKPNRLELQLWLPCVSAWRKCWEHMRHVADRKNTGCKVIDSLSCSA